MGTQSHTELTPQGAALRDLDTHPANSAPNIFPWPYPSTPESRLGPELLPLPRKRILFVTADGDPGGGVTNVLQLCRALKNDGGWHVSICSQTNSYAVQQARTLCDDVYEIDFFTSRFDPRVSWKLTTLIHKLTPDLIHTHGSRAALPLAYIAKRAAIPLVNTVHGFHFYQKSRLFRACSIKAEQQIAQHAHMTIFVCDDDRKIATHEKIARDAQPNITVHHGIELKELPRKKSNKRPTVVLLARLVPQKNPEMLIEIADLLRDTGIIFQFIGGGPLQAKLEAEIARRGLQDIVTISGKVSHQAALRLAARADLAVFPSLWEGFPIALLELLGMGVPVIASSVNGIPEAIQDGVNGFLVEERNARMYAERIRWLMMNTAMRSTFARNARSSVAAHFSEARMAADHMDIYRSIVHTTKHGDLKTL